MVSRLFFLSSFIFVALRARPPNLPDFQPQGCVSPEIEEPYTRRSGASVSAKQLAAAKMISEIMAALKNMKILLELEIDPFRNTPIVDLIQPRHILTLTGHSKKFNRRRPALAPREGLYRLADKFTRAING